MASSSTGLLYRELLPLVPKWFSGSAIDVLRYFRTPEDDSELPVWTSSKAGNWARYSRSWASWGETRFSSTPTPTCSQKLATAAVVGTWVGLWTVVRSSTLS